MQNGFILKSIQSEQDIDRLALFNKRIHEGEDLETLVRMLIAAHPYGMPHHWLFIENAQDDRIVSSVALIPWKISFCGVTLPVAELGFVGTDPAFRRQGLTRLLIEQFHRTVERDGFVCSFLQGIPFFYRQFGYEYALPLETHVNLKLSRIAAHQSSRLSVRLMRREDLPVIGALYTTCMEAYPIHTKRSAAVWKYLLGPSLHTEMVHDTYCVEDRRRGVTAYFRIARYGFGEGLILD